MIFVTVGTHEQQFNRLIQCVDELKGNGVIDEEVVIQTGYSTYEPKNCDWKKLFPYKKMIKYVSEARIVISHGGPSSFIMPLQLGKIPIVVPRQAKYEEHVNDHQLEFVKNVANRQGNVILIENIEQLKDTILNYDNIISAMPVEINSNNKKFNEEFQKIVDSIMKK